MRDNDDLANYQTNVAVTIYAFNEFLLFPKSYKIFHPQYHFDENIPKEIDFGECHCC